MIAVASLVILYEAGKKFLLGPTLTEIGLGTAVEGLVVVVNGTLGLLLIWAGRRRRSLIVEADGRHVLTDSVTSMAVLIGLVLCWIGKNPWFDSLYFDKAFAVLAALNILREGVKLMRRAIGGLMDKADYEQQRAVSDLLAEACRERGIGMHQLKVRNSGTRCWIQVHLLFPDVSLVEAHRVATEIEALVDRRFPGAMTTTHLEPRRNHRQAHGRLSEENI